MRTAVWSFHALEQYANAVDYLAERNERAATSLALKVRDAMDRLLKRPTGRPGQVAGTFEKIIAGTSYLLVYELAGDELRVLRLFHMRQDWRTWDPDAED